MFLNLSAFLNTAAGGAVSTAAGSPQGPEGSTQAPVAEGLFSLLLSGRLRLMPGAPGLEAGPEAGRPAAAQPAAGLQPLPLSGKPLPAFAATPDGAAPVALALPEGRLADDLAAWLEQAAAGDPQAREAALRVLSDLQWDGAPAPVVQTPAVSAAAAGDPAEADRLALTRLLQAAAPPVQVERAAAEAMRALQGPVSPAEAKDPGTPVTAAVATVEAAQRTAEPTVRPAAPAQAALDVPVGQRGWDQALGSRIVWMSNDQLQHAKLNLNPPNLGPLEVRLSVQQDQSASVSFVSHHAAVRDAVEAAIPRLRDMLADSGVNLADVNVSGEPGSRAQSQAGEGGGSAAQPQGTLAAADKEEEGSISQGTHGTGLVDCFV